MFYELRKNVPVPTKITNDTSRGRRKYPFDIMEPIDPKTKKGDCLEIEGEKEATLALVRMRSHARETGKKFIAKKTKDAHGKLKTVEIWRVE